MALIEKLKDTVTGAAHVARSAGHQVQSTAGPAALQAARLIRSRLNQRRTASPPDRTPEPHARATPTAADGPRPLSEPADAPTAPTPAVVAKNIAPHPELAKPATKKKAAAKKSAPGAKLPVKRPPTKPDRG
jgi:hypothetical protein